MEEKIVNIEKAVEYIIYIRDDVVIKSTRRAINRAVKNGVKNISIGVRKDKYSILSSKVKSIVKTETNTFTKKLDDMSGSIVVPHVPMPLGYFKPQKVRLVINTRFGMAQRTGYNVKIKGKRKFVKKAFMMKTKAGDNLYMRTGKERTPFRKLFTTSIRDVVSNNPVLLFVKNESIRMFEKTFNDSIRYYLSKK
jgi:hypothetical protein